MARKSAADKKLDDIRNILFPPTKVNKTMENGEQIKFMIDYSVDNNLYAALIDLREGHNDTVVQNTINKCIDSLIKVREILEAQMLLDDEAKYITVEMLDTKNVEDII
jgi:hypothetical protein